MRLKLKDKVIIKELDLKGIVVGVLTTEHGIQYRVRYFLNCKTEEVFFYAKELSKI